MYKYQTIKAISLKLWSITHLYATSHWLKFQKRATNIILETRKIVICNKALNAVYRGIEALIIDMVTKIGYWDLRSKFNFHNQFLADSFH